MAEPIEIAILAKDQFSGPLADVSKALSDIHPAVGMAAGALTAIGSAMYAAAMETVDYADEVRKMMQLSGESAEESSKIIQVMDDYKVSTDTLTMATKTLAKEGLSLNIETLAQLSDEYKSLGSGAEKTAFLVEKFGKSGLQMAEAMEQGGDAIRDASDAIDKNLVLTQEGVDAARDYQREVDNLNDAWQALTIQLGTKTIPVLNKVLSGLNTQMALTGKSRNEIISYIKGMQDAATASQSATQSYTAMAAAYATKAAATKTAVLSEQEMKAAAEAATAANQSLLSVTMQLTTENSNYTTKLAGLNAEQANLKAQIDDLISKGWSPMSDKVQDITDKYDANAKAIQDVQKAHDDSVKKIAYDLVLMKLKADGFSDAEFKMALKMGEALGVIDPKAAAIAKKMDEIATAALDPKNKVDDITEAIKNIPTYTEVEIHTKYTSEGNPPSTGSGSTGSTQTPQDVMPSNLLPTQSREAVNAVTSEGGFTNYGFITVNSSNAGNLADLMREMRRYQVI